MNINEIKHNLKTNVPVFKAGDTVRVKVKVVEGDNERLQAFDGVVIARRGSGISETFTVRKISFGVGVERIFPVHSPRVDSIEVLKVGKVRRAKLNYLTKLSGKAARLQEVKKVVTANAAAETTFRRRAMPNPRPPLKRPKRRNSYPNGITNSEHTPAVTSPAGVFFVQTLFSRNLLAPVEFQPEQNIIKKSPV